MCCLKKKTKKKPCTCERLLGSGAHEEGNEGQGCEVGRRKMFTRNVGVRLENILCVWIFVYCRTINIKKINKKKGSNQDGSE